MLSCRRDRTSHWWADPCADLSGIQGSNVESLWQWNIGKAPRLFAHLLWCLSPTLAFSDPWTSLWLGWNSHSLHSFQASHHPATIFILRQGSWIKTFSYNCPLFKKINHYFPLHNWELNLGSAHESSLEFSVWPLVSQPVAFPSSSSKA